MSEYFKIGKLVATFGFKGELILKHNLGKKTSLKGLEHFFVEEGTNNFLPYFIQSTKIKNDEELYIIIEGFDTKETAKKLVAKEVWLLEEDFTKYSSKSAPISFLGYNLIDGKNDLGKILEVIEQPHQILCTLSINDKEVLIPLHEDSLEKIDKKNRKIYVALPDGLLDIYIG
ncbi:ribosome maturation factor RimM [Ferruginibacter albus]|uniref:ribosome maturation factor RimM n=1 Tax=Ferruginibacter albus TaxID=2875540 RepID=UPI001CC40425|nr:16S rRNA processing protein RimM [Ferruginibacter albus]UAY51612.1 16S rRNA processing protein RimM [Ferruginibacter albus]